MNVKQFDKIKNKKFYNDFFYLGMLIPKSNFEKTQIADICNKLNEIKHQLFQEPAISEIHSEKRITESYILENMDNISLICSVDKEVYLSFYNRKTKQFCPLTVDLLLKLNDSIIYEFTRTMNKTANKIKMGFVHETTIKDQELLQKWNTYINNLKKLPNNFQQTYQVCFTCNLGKIITSDEELRQAIKRRELLFRNENENQEMMEEKDYFF